MCFKGDAGGKQILAKSVSRFGVGLSSKPGGKLTLSKMRASATQQTDSLGSQRVSLGDCGRMLAPAPPPAPAHRSAPAEVDPLKLLSNSIPQSVPSQSSSTSQPFPPELESYSYTESDLLSHNSYLKSTFSSLASSTQTSDFSVSTPARDSPSGRMESTHSFVSAGAGPHCPPPTSDNGMTLESSLVQRGSRARASRLKLSGLRVLGKNFGTHVLSALRMVFKSYEPAVQLTRKSLKGPDYEADGEQLEQFAYQLMEGGEVTQPADLCMLTDVLQFTQDNLEKVLARETEVRQNLPAQKIADFALDGPVLCDLRRVIVEVGRLEEEHQNAENELLAAEFEEDSFQFQNSPSIGGEKQRSSTGMVVERGGISLPTIPPSEIIPPSIGSTVLEQQNEKGEPEKKRARTAVEETSRTGFLESEEPRPLSRTPSTASISASDEGGEHQLPHNQTLISTGAAALLRVQK